jgi:hypothetical protein
MQHFCCVVKPLQEIWFEEVTGDTVSQVTACVLWTNSPSETGRQAEDCMTLKSQHFKRTAVLNNLTGMILL